MFSRKDNLFKAIVEEYIQTANPVASGAVAEKYFPDLSSATIRNEMAELEAEGLIYQPYTSAGRMPTQYGWRYYVENFLDEDEINAVDRESLNEVDLSSGREAAKALAKRASELSDEAVLVSFGPDDVFCTGIANLFRQPEFSHAELLQSMSEVIDGLDLIVGDVFSGVGREPKILIGEENPFGAQSAAVVIKVSSGATECLFGILGPSRMDYSRNLALVKLIQELTGNLNNQE